MSKQINDLNKSLKEQLHLNEKQDKNDNNLKTKDKTIIGAINEIQNSYASAEYVDVNLKMTSGDLTKLQTTNKNNLVGAINELFQNVDSGKQLIAGAIGDSSITKDSTFQAMSNAIAGRVKPAGTAVASNVLSGKTFINSTGQTITGSMTERGYYTDYSGYFTTNDANIFIGIQPGAYLSSTGSGYPEILVPKTKVNNLRPENIVNGKEILGVWGTATINSLGGVEAPRIINNPHATAYGGIPTFYKIDNDKSLWCRGYNGYGCLGLGDTSNSKATLTQVTTNINNDVKQVAGGSAFTFIVKTNGSLWSCGVQGYLGLGQNSGNKTTFTQVTTNINNDVKQVACGYNHTVILKNDGSLWACGFNDMGQFGNGIKTNTIQFSFTHIDIGNDIKEIVCGNYYTIILKNDGSAWVTGKIGTTTYTSFTQM